MKICNISALIIILLNASITAGQNCGPQYDHAYCDVGQCCSQYGWCDTTPQHCDPATCNKSYSGRRSSCRSSSVTTITTTTITTTTNSKPTPNTTTSRTDAKTSSQSWMNTIPTIDYCGVGSGGVTCPGAGYGGYFYRCCSKNGHCGPKNAEQDPVDYCGTGCQAGYGKCDPERPRPPVPTTAPSRSDDGTCGPIVNRRCPDNLCCSGSNYCGLEVEFCGAANWCQVDYGTCHR